MNEQTFKYEGAVIVLRPANGWDPTTHRTVYRKLAEAGIDTGDPNLKDHLVTFVKMVSQTIRTENVTKKDGTPYILPKAGVPAADMAEAFWDMQHLSFGVSAEWFIGLDKVDEAPISKPELGPNADEEKKDSLTSQQSGGGEDLG